MSREQRSRKRILASGLCKIVFGVVWILLSQRLIAQELNLSSSRPTIANSATIQNPGVLQVEIGVDSYPQRVRGGRLSADAVQYMVAKYVKIAAKKCPSLTRKRVSPHVLRHTTAMELLQGGVDKTLIALWLGHESTETTQIYLDANLRMKEEALSKVAPIKTKAGR